jgi:predicted acylesterase/phospholipase RssA
MNVIRYKKSNFKTYLKNHFEKNAYLNNGFNCKLNLKIKPVISLCVSGGGFRSMLGTLGILQGLEELSLLNSVSYTSTLSGSSWAVLPWILSGQNIKKFSSDLTNRLDSFNSLKNFSSIDFEKIKLYKNFFMSFYDLFLEQKKLKKEKDLEFNFIDLYGLFISFIILENPELNFNKSLYSLTKNLNNYPYPIFNAASELGNKGYEWFEFTPYYLGNRKINYFLDSNDFNLNISSLIGILGSSFSGSFKDIIKRFIQLPLPNDFIEILEKTKNRLDSSFWGSKRLSSASIENFAYGLDSPFKDQKAFTLFDGGYISNLPLESLLNQEVQSDIIFVIDNAAILPQTAVLKDTESQLLKKGFRLPKIDYDKAKEQNISIFKGQLGEPTIIYIPLKKDLSYSRSFDPSLEKFCATTNLFYSKKQAEKLIGLSRHVIKNNKDKIFDLL